MSLMGLPEQQGSNGPASASQIKRPVRPEEQELLDELNILTEKYGQQFPNICKFVQKEADRINKGYKSAEEERILDIEGGKPIRLTFKVTVPTEKYPNFNYVGRLLGPKGSTLKAMQDISGCKLAVLGKGSMRDKEQEEKCRVEGGKYAHLNDPLHIWMQAYGTPDMVFYKLYVACKEVKKYLHADYNDEIFNEQMALLEQEGGLPKGYTAARAAPRGSRGGAARGVLPNRGALNQHRGMVAGNSVTRGGPTLANRGAFRGMIRARGPTRGLRSSRGVPRPGVNSGVTETLYEDVYEPAPPFIMTNGGSALSGNSYYEEFPEPVGSAGDGSLASFQRQVPAKTIRYPNSTVHTQATTSSTVAQKVF